MNDVINEFSTYIVPPSRRHRPIGGAVAVTTEPTFLPPPGAPPAGGVLARHVYARGVGASLMGGSHSSAPPYPAGRKGNGGSRRPSRSWGAGSMGSAPPPTPKNPDVVGVGQRSAGNCRAGPWSQQSTPGAPAGSSAPPPSREARSQGETRCDCKCAARCDKPCLPPQRG